MKDAYDKLKILSDVLKNNWPQILLIGTLLSSGATNLGQYFMIQDKETEKNQAVREVAIAFQEMIPDPPPEKKVYKLDCGICQTLMKDHKRNLH